MQEHERNRPTRAHNATNKIQEHDRIPRFCTSCIASTYSGSLFRKRIHVTTLEKRKRLNFCEMKDEKKTNNLEYCVLESVRMLRMLHLMFANADSPDRMSNIAQGTSRGFGIPVLRPQHGPSTRGEQHHCNLGSAGSTQSIAVISPPTKRRAQSGAAAGSAVRTRFSREGSSAGLSLLASGNIPK